MTNKIKSDESGGIPETPTELLSQLSASVSTTGLAESISDIISGTEFKNGNSDEAFDTVKSSSEVSSVKPLKEADNFKQRVVEEVKSKIPKGDHIQSSNDENEKSCSKHESNKENSGDLEPFNADNPSGSFKVSPSTVVIPDADMSTRTNDKNDNRPHHYSGMPYVALSEESLPTSNHPNLPKSPLKVISDTITEEEQNSPGQKYFDLTIGKNVKSCSKRDRDGEHSGDLELLNADNPCGSFKVSQSTVVKPTTDVDMSTRTNDKNDNRTHHYTPMPYVALSEESLPTSKQPNLPKSPHKAISDTITEEEQNSPQSRVLCSSNRCGSKSNDTSSCDTIVPDEPLAKNTTSVAETVDTALGNPLLSTSPSEHTENVSEIVSGHAITSAATSATTSSATTELPGVKLHPKRLKLNACYADTKTKDSSVTNVTGDDQQVTASTAAFATTSSKSTTTTAVLDIELHPKQRILKAIRNEFKTSSTSFANNVIGYDTQATTSSATSGSTSVTTTSSTTTELPGIQLHPKRLKLNACYANTKTNNSSVTNVTCDDQQVTASTAASATTSFKSTATTAVLDIELHPKRRILKAFRNEFKTSNTSFSNNVIGEDTHATTSSTTSGSIEITKVSGSIMALHPKRRKLKSSINKSKTSDIFSTTNVTAEETNPSNTTSDFSPFSKYFQMFLNIRKQIDKRRKSMFSVQPKPPYGFENYLMNKRTYVLDGNYKNHEANTQTPPPVNLHKQLKKLFDEQEKERQKLRVQHIVEKEKMVLSVEQEILRVHGRAARVLANQSVPFSVCTVLKDDEVYDIMAPEQEEKDENACSHYNGSIFYSWLQEVDDKWEKIKISLLMRHHNEAESLHAVQKMDWGWKLKELKLCTSSNSENNIDEKHVPIVLVNGDFDHIPD